LSEAVILLKRISSRSGMRASSDRPGSEGMDGFGDDDVVVVATRVGVELGWVGRGSPARKREKV
jgi:hypothetical protein